MRIADLRIQWKMASKYGTRRDLVRGIIVPPVEKIWLCKIRGKHQEKMQSYGRCIHCGKAVR